MNIEVAQNGSRFHQGSAPVQPLAVQQPSFRDWLTEMIPFLRAFARTLTLNRDDADDLCQDTLMRAWAARASFDPDTNFKAWLFTIMRNQFCSNKRRSWRSAAWDEALAQNVLVTRAPQPGAAELSDLRRAIGRLPNDQREALVLVGAAGFSYIEAAKITGSAVGTVKSRVARARRALETRAAIGTA